MAKTTIEVTDLDIRRLVTPFSRYLISDVLYYGPRKLITFSTYKRTPNEVRDDDKIMLITKGVEYRPDLVAYDFYGFVDPWWRIMEINGIYDVFDFKAGRTIRLPINIQGV